MCASPQLLDMPPSALDAYSTNHSKSQLYEYVEANGNLLPDPMGLWVDYDRY
jgi:hypothetical protein